MPQCQYHDRCKVRCDQEADECLEGELPGGVVEVVDLCKAHKKSFLEGWDRMQADAARLRERGVPKALLSRIMCARVDRNEYE
jgi:hypothetical protein